jgi:AraC-like DNA-binding protein
MDISRGNAYNPGNPTVVLAPMADARIIEILVRGAAVGAFLGLAIAVGRGGASSARVTGVLFCLAAAAHTMTQFPPIEAAIGWAWPLVWALSVAGSGLFWAFATELFGDRPRLQVSRFFPAGVLLVLGVSALLSPPPVKRTLWLVHNMVGAGLMLHVLVIIAAQWRGDLVEPRRRLRGPILAAAALYALVLAGVESAEILGLSASALSPLAAVLLLTLSLTSIAAFLRADPALFGTARLGTPEQKVSVPTQDLPLLARLREVLERDEVWRRETLGIGELASLIGAPEHRVRKLINEGLGYRNFASLLNERRIAAAQRALSDPTQARTPVSAIAYEVGFASLGPFNRAFKEATGRTPTEWRREAVSGWPNSEISG